MRKIVTALVGVFALTAHVSAAEDAMTFGGGIGALYAGIGINIGLRTDHDLKYFAAGCPAIGRSDESGWILPCGVGLGWMRSDLLSRSNNKHGLGIYLGPVGINKGEHLDDDKARYGLGVTYAYFFSGINAKGWLVGITPAIGKDDNKTKGSLLVNGGYQF